MLERESDGSWIKAAEYLIDMGYHALDGISFPDAHRLFLKLIRMNTSISAKARGGNDVFCGWYLDYGQSSFASVFAGRREFPDMAGSG